MQIYQKLVLHLQMEQNFSYPVGEQTFFQVQTLQTNNLF